MDITLSYKKKFISKITQSKYYWNEDMMQMFTETGLASPWVIPVIQGHV